MWRSRQKAKLHLYDLDAIFDESIIIPEDVKDSYQDDEKLLRKKNDLAYADLILSITDDVCFGLVMSSKTDKLEQGDARLAWIRDQYNMKQFQVYWEPRSLNKGDYFTKHHPYSNHKLIIPHYIQHDTPFSTH